MTSISTDPSNVAPVASWGVQPPANTSAPDEQLELPFIPTAPAVQTPVQPTQPVTPAVTTPAPTPAMPGKTIQQLIREFSKQAGCERYAADGEKVKLLIQYLWLRQLTPALAFEKFLDLYASVADFDKDNCKHPEEAVKQYLPRSAKLAGDGKKWTAREVVDYTALYVDMIRGAEATNTPIPMELTAFLVNPTMIEAFVRGDFKEPSQPRTSRKAAKKSVVKITPSAAGQRCIYTATGGRQHRGYTTAYWTDPQSRQPYADFKSDTGEEFKGLGAANLEVVEDAPPNPPTDQQTDSPMPELGVGRLIIPKAQFSAVQQALRLTTPMGNVAIGDTCYTFNHEFPDGKTAAVDVVNGETSPFVDARLWADSLDNVVAEINPRENIEGTYQFVTAAGTYTLEVTGNQ